MITTLPMQHAHGFITPVGAAVHDRHVARVLSRCHVLAIAVLLKQISAHACVRCVRALWACTAVHACTRTYIGACTALLACVRVYVHTCMYASSIHTHMYASSIHTHMYASSYPYTHVCERVHTCVCEPRVPGIEAGRKKSARHRGWKKKKCQASRLDKKKCQASRLEEKKCQTSRLDKKKCQASRLDKKKCQTSRLNKKKCQTSRLDKSQPTNVQKLYCDYCRQHFGYQQHRQHFGYYGQHFGYYDILVTTGNIVVVTKMLPIVVATFWLLQTTLWSLRTTSCLSGRSILSLPQAIRRSRRACPRARPSSNQSSSSPAKGCSHAV